jgi:ribonuclease HI
MTKVVIWTDGSSSGGKSGPGGYAAILISDGHEWEIVGGSAETTHQQMELMAAIVALESLAEPCTVTLHTDSAYVGDCFILGWWRRWLVNGWRNSKRKPVANQDLWERLLAQNHKHSIDWCRVPGHHVDYPLNGRCDKLAVAQKRLFKAHAAVAATVSLDLTI